MPGALTDAAAKQFVQAALAKDDPLLGWWDPLIANANAKAYNDIVACMTERGFSVAQVNAWDNLASFQADQIVYWAIMMAAVKEPDQYNLQAVAMMDRRPELTGDDKRGIKPCSLTIGGVFQDPANVQGQAVVGAQDSGTSFFGVPEDPDDGRLGQVVDF
jgi:hypothetical protein